MAQGGVIDTYDNLWIKNKESVDIEKLKTKTYRSIIQTHPLTVEQKESIDDLYRKNYGKRITYEWHQFYAAHSGKFTAEYFPDYLLQAHFEHYMNYNSRYAYVFEDKNVIPYVAKSAGVKMPKTVLSSTCGMFRDGEGNPLKTEKVCDYIKERGKLFCRPSTISCGGRGCFIKDFSILSNEIVQSLFNEMGKDFVIQELIHCHPSISFLYSKSVNTFRVITYRWKNEFFHMPVFMRIGRGGAVVDNGASGGMFIGITDNGFLTDYAVSVKELSIPTHPDTGAVFKGYQIPNFQRVINCAIKMHQMMPQIGLVYWDFTLDDNCDPVLIECNIINGTVYAIQMTHGVGPFGERTQEVLSWIRKMDSLPASKRNIYSFGEGS